MKRLLFLTAIFVLILAIASPAVAQEGRLCRTGLKQSR